MYELHGSFPQSDTGDATQRFTDRWCDDCFIRDKVSSSDGTLYIDQYTSFTSIAGQDATHGELCIAVDGCLHGVSPMIRDRLTQSVTTATPSTILAAAYRTLGWTFPQALVGDYRFLIIDQAQHRLIAGRDRTMSEAVYCAVTEETALVSTDLVALAQEIHASVNTAYVGEYLTGEIESPYETFYTDIYRIPPGCVFVSSAGSTRIERYYQPRSATGDGYQQLSRNDLGDCLREILATAVSCRTQPTEPTGIFLSGGADSTALTGLIAQQDPQPPVFTYSYLFPNTEAIDETPGITAIVDEYELHNETISLDDYWILKDKDLYERAWMHAPAVDPLLQPKHELLQRAAADGVTTMLIGDNGNILDGSRLSIADAIRNGQYSTAMSAARVDPGYTTVACLVLYGVLPLLGVTIGNETPATTIPDPVRQLLTSTVQNDIKERRQSPRQQPSLQSYRNQAIYRAVTDPLADYRNDILHKLAKYHGLCLVDPYQDARLIDFLFDVPPTYHLQDGYDKVIFRNALSDILPSVILSRLKADAIEEEEAEGLRREASYLTALLDHSHIHLTDIVRATYSYPETDALIQDFENGELHIWRLLSTHAWKTHNPMVQGEGTDARTQTVVRRQPSENTLLLSQ